MKATLHTPPRPSDPIKQPTGGRRSAAPRSPRELATKIAMRLFTNGFGGEGTRLEIKEGDGYGKEISLGGWCFQAAVAQIEKVIIEENVNMEARRQ